MRGSETCMEELSHNFTIADAVPEAIYRELPPRLQKEVQVDRSRAPSLLAT